MCSLLCLQHYTLYLGINSKLNTELVNTTPLELEPLICYNIAEPKFLW